MPNGNADDQRDDLDPDEEPDESTDESTENDDANVETDDAEGGKKVADKRVSDLQSARDKETARANKAEAALKAALARGGRDDAGDDPATKALMTELREASLDAVFGEYPELREFGIDRSLIEGTTRAELRTSATSLVGLIKNVQTKVRNKTLAEHGITAPAAGSTRKPPKSVAEMSDEEFERYLASVS